jgi:hypothetical protein
MAEIKGSCLCGAVTYRSDADPIAMANCHCADCQKQTGSAFSTVVVVPKGAFHVEGDSLSSFETMGEETGQPTVRHFCTSCGSPLVTYSQAVPEMAIVKAGTLDDRSWVVPQFDVWCDSAQPWVEGDAERQRFPRSIAAAA